MPSKGPHCCACGKQMQRGKGVLPQGRAKCRPCRRSAKGWDPSMPAKLQKAPPGQRGGPRMPSRPRDCAGCGSRIDDFGLVWCAGCRPRRSRKYVKQASTSERGYGASHMKERRRRLAEFEDGDECPRCGGPMYRTQSLDLDHTDDRSGYLGLSQSWCNRATNRRERRTA